MLEVGFGKKCKVRFTIAKTMSTANMKFYVVFESIYSNSRNYPF
jgi:hypothetical protein